ncbi:hypothetical protein PspKH34_23750 [Parageobacillus sp. KH3-4]|nr:hypothetical protein PspKH34_23750 [Parageobacillus sp. KH3-4]
MKTYLLERTPDRHNLIKEKITDGLKNLMAFSFNDGFGRKNFRSRVYIFLVKYINLYNFWTINPIIKKPN